MVSLKEISKGLSTKHKIKLKIKIFTKLFEEDFRLKKTVSSKMTNYSQDPSIPTYIISHNTNNPVMEILLSSHYRRKLMLKV